MIKRNRERGSPCLIPLVGEKQLLGDPFRRMAKNVEDIRLETHLTQGS